MWSSVIIPYDQKQIACNFHVEPIQLQTDFVLWEHSWQVLASVLVCRSEVRELFVQIR